MRLPVIFLEGTKAYRAMMPVMRKLRKHLQLFGILFTVLVALATCDQAQVGEDACRKETHCHYEDGVPTCDEGYEILAGVCVVKSSVGPATPDAGVTDAQVGHADAQVDRADAQVDRADAQVDRADAQVDRADAQVDRADAQVDRADAQVDPIDASNPRCGLQESYGELSLARSSYAGTLDTGGRFGVRLDVDLPGTNSATVVLDLREYLGAFDDEGLTAGTYELDLSACGACVHGYADFNGNDLSTARRRFVATSGSLVLTAFSPRVDFGGSSVVSGRTTRLVLQEIDRDTGNVMAGGCRSTIETIDLDTVVNWPAGANGVCLLAPRYSGLMVDPDTLFEWVESNNNVFSLQMRSRLPGEANSVGIYLREQSGAFSGGFRPGVYTVDRDVGGCGFCVGGSGGAGGTRFGANPIQSYRATSGTLILDEFSPPPVRGGTSRVRGRISSVTLELVNRTSWEVVADGCRTVVTDWSFDVEANWPR